MIQTDHELMRIDQTSRGRFGTMQGKEAGGTEMTNHNKAPKPVMRWLTLVAIMFALAVAASTQGSDRPTELAGSHTGPSPEGASKITLVGEPEHERDLRLSVII